VYLVRRILSNQKKVKTKAILKEAHDKVRDLSHELLPSLLARFGLFYALNDLCEKTQIPVSSLNIRVQSIKKHDTMLNLK
jgi:signal transduction histidine kinase